MKQKKRKRSTNQGKVNLSRQGRRKGLGDILLCNIPFTGIPMLFVYIGVMIALAVFSVDKPPFEMVVSYSSAPEGNATLYYYEDEEWKTKEELTASISDNRVKYKISKEIAEAAKTFRLDPLDDSGKIAIRDIAIRRFGLTVKRYGAKELKSYIAWERNLSKVKADGRDLTMVSENSAPMLCFYYGWMSDISLKLEDYAHIVNSVRATVLFLGLMAVITFWREITLWWGEYVERTSTPKLSAAGMILYFTAGLLAVLTGVLYTVKEFLLKNFNGLSLEEVIFHLKVPMEGTSSSMLSDYFEMWTAAIVVFAAGFLLLTALLVWKKRIRNCKSVAAAMALAALVFGIVQLVSFSIELDVPEYVKAQMSSSDFIEKNYVDPGQTDITYPEKKRNLIWIYMESLESSFLSKKEGGAMKENLLPKLTDLAEKNINFSSGDGVGGLTSSEGTTWTSGALFAQTSGLPLLIPIDGNSYGKYSSFAPGAVSLGELLQKEGYRQMLMVGSDIKFGGRDLYFRQHGDYEFYDLATAREKGKIDDDYMVWWGFEDQKLYSYAREEILKMAEGDAPFQFSMLTVDTHHVDGYRCKLCRDTYDSNYKNVISCADRQLDSFIQWIQKQDFYKNTTIVISGDHPTMDAAFVETYYDSDVPHQIYNCFVNSAVDTDYEKNREANSFDLYPSVLAAMGAKIEGERLGLGTNLFSGQETLAEQYGLEYIDGEFSKNSKFYKKKILKE